MKYKYAYFHFLCKLLEKRIDDDLLFFYVYEKKTLTQNEKS